ncbi:thiamine pyrophosphate-dependent enzyme, partial [Streptomyces sp. SID13726]|uniref:thiamine pyrophosphate-dependent enzyme n=1 Tax=Streptomyces sp. SID13726 TaxID=2706058 RepID=UPI0013B8CE00
LGMVRLEMLVDGLPMFGTESPQVDYAAVANAIGIPAVRVEKPKDLRRALQDALHRPGPALVDVVRERGLGLTCCPVSNSFVTDDMKATEIAGLLRSGVRVTVNSDDPAYFGGYVADNYVALADAADLTTQEVVQLARNSFEASWLGDSQRAAFLAELDRYVAAYDATAV